MAVLRASPLLPQSLSPSSTCRSVTAAALAARAAPPAPLPPSSRGVKTGIHDRARKRLLARRTSGGRKGVPCLPTEKEVGVTGGGEEQENDEEYLVRESGWGVRRMGRVGEEMRRVALVQAEAFHVPVALFNDFFFNFFKAEVLSALIYRVRNSPLNRYACLVAEAAKAASRMSMAPFENIVGVVDCTVQDEDDILKHLKGADEYLYVSGIAVLPSFRRRKVGTALLKACEALALQWRHRFMALRAYEDDDSARGLYAKAGYRVVSRDPDWVTWVGRRRRVLMIKELPVHDHQMEQQ
ncbi:GCN5-related N-acetyltransferase 10, chloroplastic [Phragmites australis]|uniref:GCN5-related N-acetyltransferase 10, chloroplastic n=1 Tax=Phragmites australis TaxID=29695 RepID=UPI002D786B78|nr:GCN5-related N-acetyltransferase 10, chloroplastic [Phragmites australis]